MIRTILYDPAEDRLTLGGEELIEAWAESDRALLWIDFFEIEPERERGLMRERFGQRHPLSLSASFCFEQSYGGIDGDSASSTELFALLSALAHVPIRQSIAVTGSVNQKGQIQPIGGINEKIEGFFRLCRARRLSGQMVILPRANLDDLMLDREVQRAVQEGKFSVHAIDRIEDAAEIVLKRSWQEISERVAQRLERFRIAARELGHA